jgi:hypothetical protein
MSRRVRAVHAVSRFEEQFPPEVHTLVSFTDDDFSQGDFLEVRCALAALFAVVRMLLSGHPRGQTPRALIEGRLQ